MTQVQQRKDDDEVARIRANAQVLDRALQAVRDLITPGRREAELWAALLAVLADQVGDEVLPAGNLATGRRTLEDDPHAIQRALIAGDPVLLDAYPIISGYAVGLCRTWFCGPPAEPMRRAHTALGTTLTEVERLLRPLVTAGDIDALAREVLAAELGGPSYPHHTGHGIGVRQQKRPWLIPHSADVLAPGMVIAIELGCYLPEHGGVRLEHNFLPVGTQARFEITHVVRRKIAVLGSYGARARTDMPQVLDLASRHAIQIDPLIHRKVRSRGRGLRRPDAVQRRHTRPGHHRDVRDSPPDQHDRRRTGRALLAARPEPGRPTHSSRSSTNCCPCGGCEARRASSRARRPTTAAKRPEHRYRP